MDVNVFRTIQFKYILSEKKEMAADLASEICSRVDAQNLSSGNCSTLTAVTENYLSLNRTLLFELNALYREQSWPLVAFMICLMVLGIPGNGIVIWVYNYKKSKSIANHFMLSLAWVDFCACLIIHPYIIYKYFTFYTANVVVCKILEYLIHSMLAVQIAILVSVAVDRYYAVCKPLRFIYYYNRAVVMVIGSVICGTAISLPLLLFYGDKTVTLDLGDEGIVYGRVCHYNDTYDGSLAASIFMGFTVILMIGMTVSMIVLYVMVIAEVCKKNRVVFPARDLEPNTISSAKKGKPILQDHLADNKADKQKDTATKSTTAESAATSVKSLIMKEVQVGVTCNLSHNSVPNEVEICHTQQEILMLNGSHQAESDDVPEVLTVKVHRENQTLSSNTTIDCIKGQTSGRNSDGAVKDHPAVKMDPLILQKQEDVITELEQSSPRRSSIDNGPEVKQSNAKTSAFDIYSTCPIGQHFYCPIVPVITHKKSLLRDQCSLGNSANKTVTFDEESHVVEIAVNEAIQEDPDKNVVRSGRSVICPGLKAAKMLSIVTVVFFVTWLPFWILRVKTLSDPNIWTLQSLSGSFLFQILNHLFYLNNSINPLLYSVVNNNFRNDLKAAWSKSTCVKMFKKKGKKNKKKKKVLKQEGNE